MDNINLISIDELVIKSKSRFITFRGHLFSSLFSGEYYSLDFSDKVKLLIENLDKVYENLTSSNKFIKERYELARDYLLHFQYLNLFITNRLRDNYSTKIYNFEYEDVFSRTSFFKEKTISTDDSFHWLFVANIKLSEMDEGYCVDEKTILILSEIYHKLERIDISLESFILKTRVKCSVLLYKIFKRLNKTSESIKNIEYSIFNDENITIDKLEENVPEEIIKKINIQYECEEKKEIYSTNKHINTLIKDSKLNVIDAHNFIKIVKFKKNYTDFEYEKTKLTLEKINVYFSEKIKENEINNISYKTSCYLVLNCGFKLECNFHLDKLKNNLKYEKLLKYNSLIDESFKNINSLENKDYPNCILNRIYIKKKIELIQIIKDSNPKELNDEEHDYFSVLETIFTNSFKELNYLKNKIRVCQKNKIMPLYIELNNCKIDNNTFIDSQYILPSNYEYLAGDCENDWDKLKFEESIFYSFTPKVIKELNEKLKKDIKEQQYSIITVIGLYASFITFILANVNVLPELIKHSIGSVFAFMLVFGTVIFFFIASLKLLFTSNAKEVIKGVSNFVLWLIFGFAVSITGVYAIFYYSKTGFKKEIKNTTVTTFDLKTGKKTSETKTLESEIKDEIKQK